MTKKIKQILGAVMAAMLCFALTPAAAFAAGETITNQDQGKIKISNAIDGKSYSIYQMLELTRFNADNNSYSYKAANELWAAFLSTDEAKKYVEVSVDGYVAWKDGVSSEDNLDLPVSRDAAVAKFAELAINYAKTNGIAASETKSAEGASVEFTNLSLGYYLVDSSTGAICSLATTNTDADIVEKNGVPTVNKMVQEDSLVNNEAEGYGKTNDAQIGDTINFKTVITGQPGAVNYTLHDTMSDGLTFDPNSVVLTRGNSKLESGTDYTLVSKTEDNCTFEISFSSTLCNTLGVNDQIVVTYSATLNNEAIVAGDGNDNTTKLTYGDGAEVHETLESITTTYTWDLNVFKHDESNTALSGAKFEIALKSNPETPIKMSVAMNKENTYKADPNGTVVEITTDATGSFTIQGLDADTYLVTEKEAPSGFNKLTSPLEVIVGIDTSDPADGIIDTAVLDVENKAGSILPSTGGMGTTILYVVGGVLVIGAIIFLVRRRSSATK